MITKKLDEETKVIRSDVYFTISRLCVSLILIGSFMIILNVFIGNEIITFLSFFLLSFSNVVAFSTIAMQRKDIERKKEHSKKVLKEMIREKYGEGVDIEISEE